MKIAEKNIVTLNYVLKNDGGEILDQSNGNPIEFMQGTGNIIPGLDSQILGLEVGEKKLITVDPKDAYGEYSEKLVQTVSREMFQGVEKVEVGMQFHAQGPQGPFMLIVKAVDGDEITVDGNHELAGETLHFDIEVADIREATEEELMQGHPHQEGGCCGGHGHSDESGCCGGAGHDDGSECCGGAGHDDGSECCGGAGHDDGSECCGGTDSSDKSKCCSH